MKKRTSGFCFTLFYLVLPCNAMWVPGHSLQWAINQEERKKNKTTVVISRLFEPQCTGKEPKKIVKCARNKSGVLKK